MSNHERKKTPSAFLRNIFNILQNTELNQIIQWAPAGNGFVIKNLPYFQANTLPQYFKHKKYSSFVRQLNMYGFHKQRNSNFENCFLHQQFRRGDELPVQIKRKPQKKKKTNDSHENLPKSEDWLSFGQELRQHFPHIADNIMIKPEKQVKKNIVLTNQRKMLIQHQKIIQKMIDQCSEEEQYVSKICLKGLMQEFDENPQAKQPQNSQSKPMKSQQSDSDLDHDLSYSTVKQDAQVENKDQKSESVVEQSHEQANKIVQVNKLEQEQYQKQIERSFSKFAINMSENTLQSLTALSEIMIRQNQILRRTHPSIRNMVLKSQENKIQYLSQQLKDYDEHDYISNITRGGRRLNEILKKQQGEFIKLASLLQKQIQNLTEVALNEESRPISTTSIRLDLEKLN